MPLRGEARFPQPFGRALLVRAGDSDCLLPIECGEHHGQSQALGGMVCWRAVMAMGVFIGPICLSIVNETISKIGARHLESALERFTGGSARVETGAIPKTLPAPPQAAAAEQPPCISESPATIVAKLK